MQDGQSKIFVQGKLTFIITPTKIVIKTSLGQCFYLLPKAHYWVRRLRLVSTMITLNEIRDLNELASWTGEGIEWVSTSMDYAIDNKIANSNMNV